MPRLALTPLAATILVVIAVIPMATPSAAALDPHLDPGRTPGGCQVCHAGHGVSGSPMLPESQSALCRRCHGNQADLGQEVVAGKVAAEARPPLLATVMALPFTHPVDEHAFSATEPGRVTCTSCHSPHRAMAQPPGTTPAGQRKLSPKNPGRFEFQLCQSCHGSTGSAAFSDVGDLTHPGNRSYHPVQAPTAGSSPSVSPKLAGREINCTDCHGNSTGGPRGPHGSLVPFLLRSGYTTTDGAQESAASYELCYDCHDRAAILDDSTFPEHRRHVVEERTSCATCHDPHGSVENRALIRIFDGTLVPGVSASGATGRLAFISDSPGSGACYLTCHGEDHDPLGYGGLDVLVESLDRPVPELGSSPRGHIHPPATPPPAPRRPRRPLERPPDP